MSTLEWRIDRSITASGLGHFLEHQLRRFRVTLRPTLVQGLISPLLFLAAIGFGVGSQIEDPAALGTADYASFVGPGVLAAIAMLTAGGQSLWATLASLKWEGTYPAALTTPLTAAELATGHVIWLGLRALLSSTLFTIVLVLFGIPTEWSTFAAPFAAAATGVAFGGPVSAFTGMRDTDNGFSVINRVVLTPLFLFSGAFFPLDQIPAAAAWIVRVFPVWHGVELCRGLIVGGPTALTLVGHSAYLALWILAGWFLATTTFTNRLAR